MYGFAWWGIALWLVFSITIFGVIYASAYGLIARFGMGLNLRFGRSFVAACIGLPLAAVAFGLTAMTLAERGVQGVVPAIGASLVPMLVMTAVNVLLLRTDTGAQVNFIQAFFAQFVPTVILVTLSVVTRPPGYY